VFSVFCVAENRHEEWTMRHLRWDACRNVRDLGGYAVAGGSTTRWGAFVRADNLVRLTPAGRAALLDYGVRTIVDLRRPEELAVDPSPFAPAGAGAGLVAYHSLPFGAGADSAGIAAVVAAEAAEDFSMDALYRAILDHYGRGIAAIMTALAQAPEGPALFHCHAGKDRTGLIAALILALVGVPHATIAEDYTLTQVCLQPVYDQRLSAEPDPSKREQLARRTGAVPETMLGILAHLDARHGGAEAYLRAAGVAAEDVARLRRRILGGDPPTR